MAENSLPEKTKSSTHASYYHKYPGLEERFWLFVEKGATTDECWRWTGNTIKKNYGRLGFHRKRFLAHRVSFFIHHGRWPSLEVLHKCGNPICVNPLHLAEGTHKENMQDMVTHGRQTAGEKNCHAKLTDDDVRSIRARSKDGATRKELIQDFGVNRRTIDRIVTGRTWRHLPHN